VIDEWAGIGPCNSGHVLERPDKNRGRVSQSDISAREYECSDARLIQRQAFQLSITDPFVARQHNPAMAARFSEPYFVGSAPREVLRRSLYCRTRFA